MSEEKVNNPYTVAVTGGMGSGKTTVVNNFKDLGIPVYIADDEAKALMQEDKNLVSAIEQNFGQKAYDDNGLNKAYLASQVFGNPKQLKKLNNLVHPVVRRHFQNWLNKQTTPYVIYESALIFEHNQQHLFDFIILVTAPKKLRIDRIKNRNHWSEKDILNSIKNQMEDNLKNKYVNYIIENIDKKLIRYKVNIINEKILNNI